MLWDHYFTLGLLLGSSLTSVVIFLTIKWLKFGFRKDPPDKNKNNVTMKVSSVSFKNPSDKLKVNQFFNELDAVKKS